METTYSQFSQHLYIHHGHVNTGIVRDENRAILIDPSGATLQTTLDELGITKVEQILFTHHHRDSSSGFPIPENIRIGVPDTEAQWFAKVETFWNDPKFRWHLYNCHPHNLMLSSSITVTDKYAEGDELTWGSSDISVIETPGHTEGSVTYLVDADGQRFAFTGDLIYDEGKIWELYSLQKGQQTTDYHGFLGARDELKESLEKVRKSLPTALIPTHGIIMNNPNHAIDKLFEKLDYCYDKYVSISALRHYFPKLFTDFEGRVDHMPIREGKPSPNFLRHYGTTWLIISENREAFVMDCGSPNVVKQIQQLIDEDDISKVSQFWVTHYHDDHVNAIPEFQQTFPCETITDTIVAEVITNPKAFRLPCISPAITRVDRTTCDGDIWQWNEFTMTAYHFPGQTYYHGGLLVEGHGVRMFFSGDSFTMAGIDDYCSGNRNLLGSDVGYERCLRLIQELKPTHIFNCHVDPAFDFTDKEINFMLDTLAEREKCYTDLFPWDHANYGMDDQWVRCKPYEQDVNPGETVSLHVEITNHSNEPRTAIAKPILPSSWGIDIDPRGTTIPAKSDGQIQFSLAIPSDCHDSGRVVVPIDITYQDRPLGQFREAIFVLK